MKLTPQQENALISLHFSGSLLPTLTGYVYKDKGDKADMRSLNALIRRGLAQIETGLFMNRGGVICGNIYITEEGDNLAEQLLTKDSQLRSYMRRW